MANQRNLNLKITADTKNAQKGFKALLTGRYSLAALGLSVGTAIKEFAEFEDSITKVFTLMSGAGEQAMQDLTDGVLELTTVIPQSAEELSEALFDVVSAGVDAGEAVEFLGASAKLAVAGVTDTKTAVRGLTASIAAYGMETSEVNKIADKFFTAQKFGQTTIREISDSIGNVAPVAATAGVSFDELISVMSALTLQGINTAEASTALNQAISNIISPSEQAVKTAKSLGIEFNAQALEAKGLIKFLDDVTEATGNNVELNAQLFGSIRGLKAISALANNEFAKANQIQDALTTSTGAVEEAFAKQAATLKNEFKLLSNSVSTLSKLIIGEFAPAINMVLSGITRLTNSTINGFKFLKRTILGSNEEIKQSSASLNEQLVLNNEEANNKILKKEKETSEKIKEIKKEEVKAKNEAEKEFRDQQERMGTAYLEFSKDLGEELINGEQKVGKVIGQSIQKFLIQEILAWGAKESAKAVAAAPLTFGGTLLALAPIGAAVSAGIAAVSAIKFQQGGIVPGNQTGGDQISARVNSGEMILNREQQQSLFNMINGGGMGGGGLTVNINGGIFTGDRQQMKQLARMIDEELITLRRQGVSLAV